jgi:hypothetical protein
MVKDLLDSLKDNFAQKVRNPILATIIIIWSFKNWRLIYSLFTFDPKLTQKERLDYIDKYFVDFPFYPILGYCIWYAFIVLFLTYLILGGSRLIVDSYEHKLLPFLKKITDSTGIVARERFNLVLRELDEIRDKFNLEREAKLKAQTEREQFEKMNSELILESRKVAGLNAEIERLNKKIGEFEIARITETDSREQIKYLSRENSELKELNKTLYNEKQRLIKTIGNPDLSDLILTSNVSDEEILNLLNSDASNPVKNEEQQLTKTVSIIEKLKANNLMDDYLTIGKAIINNEALKLSEGLKTFVGLKLIKDKYVPKLDYGFYSFTKIGKEIYDSLIYLPDKSRVINNTNQHKSFE